MEKRRVLIICPIRDELDNLERLVTSLYDLQEEDWVVFFGDNGSPPETKERIIELSSIDSRFQSFFFETKVDVMTSFVRTIIQALETIPSEYVQLMGSDDVLQIQGPWTPRDEYFDNQNIQQSFKLGRVHQPGSGLSTAKETDFAKLSSLPRALQVFQHCLHYEQCNLMYATVNRKLFEKLMQSNFRLSTGLSSDWWFSLGLILYGSHIYDPLHTYQKSMTPRARKENYYDTKQKTKIRILQRTASLLESNHPSSALKIILSPLMAVGEIVDHMSNFTSRHSLSTLKKNNTRDS